MLHAAAALLATLAAGLLFPLASEAIPTPLGCPLPNGTVPSGVPDQYFALKADTTSGLGAQASCEAEGAILPTVLKTNAEFKAFVQVVPNTWQEYIGLSNPNLISCANAKCDGLLQYNDNTTFAYNSSWMGASLSILVTGGAGPCLNLQVTPPKSALFTVDCASQFGRVCQFTTSKRYANDDRI